MAGNTASYKTIEVNMIDLNHQLKKYLSTNEAAEALNRSPQTLRKWACLEIGPLKPTRIHGRLAWSIEDIVTLQQGGLNVGS